MKQQEEISLDFLAEQTGLNVSVIKKELGISSDIISKEALQEKVKKLATDIFES